MRSTRASAALNRLKKRSGKENYALEIGADGLLSLLEVDQEGGQHIISPRLELDDFVRFVDATGPQQVKKVSKLDVAFEKQLQKK